MIVRCGRCQTGFDVPGPGRHVCPSCGTTNQVGAAAPASASPPAPLKPEAPSPRVVCGECGFSFIIGDVVAAPCPNCGTPVTVRADEGEDE